MTLFMKLLLCVVIAPTFLGYIVERNVEGFSDSRTLEFEFQGLKRDNTRVSRAAVTDETKLWADRIIYYKIDEKLRAVYPNDLMSVFLEATELIENHTCVKFKEWDGEHPNYVQIVDGDKCFSQVGSNGGRQDLVLANGCISHQVVLYLLMRVIGFYNEMNRSDRDDYVEVRRERLDPDYSEEFRQMNPEEHNLLDTDFDFDSIMMYASIIYSRFSNLPVVRPRSWDITVNYTDMTLSSTDILRINRLYTCCALYEC